MNKIRYIPAMWGHYLQVMDLTNFSVMKITGPNGQPLKDSGVWYVMPDFNKVEKSPWIFNPMYNTSLMKEI